MDTTTNAAIDPVCGMQVRDEAGALKTEYAGQTYFFCSEDCRTAFEQEPQRFAQQANVEPGKGQGQERGDKGTM